jgi:hypothetical protein
MPKTQDGFEVADTFFSVSEDIQDGQSRRVRQHFAQVRLFPVSYYDDIFVHNIQIIEYNTSSCKACKMILITIIPIICHVGRI